MIPETLDAITEAHLRRLIEDEVHESKSLEYKLALPDDTSDGRREFLKDVSALANTDGGDLLYGVKEHNGLPVELTGLQVPDQDALRQQLENRLRDGTQPRIPDIRFQFIPVSTRAVLVVRVAKSWAAPHRVVIAGHGHFYGRNSVGTFPFDVDQLRDAFVRAQALEDRIRLFRDNRVAAISGGSVPVPLVSGAIYVLHVVPLSAFTSRDLIPMELLRNNMQAFDCFNTGGYTHRTNVDGIVQYGPHRGSNSLYTQVYRNGCVEAVAVFEPRNDGVHVEQRLLPAPWYERHTLQAVERYMRALASFGVMPPVYLFISVMNAAGYKLETGDWLSGRGEPLDRETLLLPEAVIDSEQAKPGSALKPIFDMLWHAFDHAEGTPNISPAGEWVKSNS